MLAAIIATYAVFTVLAVSAFRAGGSAPTWFAGNVAAVWITAAMVFGYPGLIVVALALVAGMFTVIIAITWSR